MRFNSNKLEVSELILRIWIGVAMISHSALKVFNFEYMLKFSSFVENLGFPLPLIFAYLAKGSEFFGGILLILGLFTRTASLFIFVTMFVAVFLSDKGAIFGDAELGFTYLLISIYFLINGANKISLDYFWKKKE